MTVHYDFPCIQYWHTIAQHFEGNDSFIVVDKDEYFVVNYVRSGKETHPPVDIENGYARAAVLREARGMIFCKKTGELLSRPFQKFFNLGEREDLIPDFSKPHYIVDKLDGSMIRPVPLPSGIRWGTKMGITDVAMQAEEFVSKHPKYQKFAEACIEANATPLFEWCSRQQRIVLDYPEDNLVLLAVRDNFTGEYVARKGIEVFSQVWDIPVVRVHEMCWARDNSEDFITFIRSMTGIEGFVIQFHDGHMVKIKTDEYVSLHRAKSLLDNERDVVGLILEEKIDDLMPLLPEPDHLRLRKFADDVWGDILRFQTDVNILLRQTRNIPRKEFALASTNIPPLLRAAAFKFYGLETNCDLGYIVNVMSKKLGSKSSFKVLDEILKTASWKGSIE
jgi:RNA ligase